MGHPLDSCARTKLLGGQGSPANQSILSRKYTGNIHDMQYREVILMVEGLRPIVVVIPGDERQGKSVGR